MKCQHLGRKSAECRQWEPLGAVAKSTLWANIQHTLSTNFSKISAHYCWKLPVKKSCLVCPYRLIYARDHKRERVSKTTMRTLRRWPRVRIPDKCHWRTLCRWSRVKSSRFTASGGILCHFSPTATMSRRRPKVSLPKFWIW